MQVIVLSSKHQVNRTSMLTRTVAYTWGNHRFFHDKHRQADLKNWTSRTGVLLKVITSTLDALCVRKNFDASPVGRWRTARARMYAQKMRRKGHAFCAATEKRPWEWSRHLPRSEKHEKVLIRDALVPPRFPHHPAAVSISMRHCPRKERRWRFCATYCVFLSLTSWCAPLEASFAHCEPLFRQPVGRWATTQVRMLAQKKRRYWKAVWATTWPPAVQWLASSPHLRVVLPCKAAGRKLTQRTSIANPVFWIQW